MTIELIKGEDLKVGMEILTGYSEVKTITGFAPHPGLMYNGAVCTARIMKCDETHLDNYHSTLFDGDSFRVASDGVYVSTHMWFSYQERLK
jgi:hypothetical protein